MILRRFQLNFDHNNQYLDCLGEEFLVSLSSRGYYLKKSGYSQRYLKATEFTQIYA